MDSDGGCAMRGGESFAEDRARLRPPVLGPGPMFSSEVTDAGSGAKGFASEAVSDPARDLFGETDFRLMRTCDRRRPALEWAKHGAVVLGFSTSPHAPPDEVVQLRKALFKKHETMGNVEWYAFSE